MRVGFIGLGNMGSGMARNLIRAGHQLTVYNRTRQRAESLESLGARVVSSPAEAASAAEALITMLADDGAVEDALLGQDGAMGALPPGAVHVGMSTISVQLSRRLAAEHQAKQQQDLIRHCRSQRGSQSGGDRHAISAADRPVRGGGSTRPSSYKVVGVQ